MGTNMKKISNYVLISSNSGMKSFIEDVNTAIKERGYELYGTPFYNGVGVSQALIKYEEIEENQVLEESFNYDGMVHPNPDGFPDLKNKHKNDIIKQTFETAEWRRKEDLEGEW